MEEFCKKLPKIELHAHLNGSLSMKTLKDLGCLTESVDEYQSLTKILRKTTRTLDECFQLFSVAHKATSNTQSVYKATASVIEEFHQDNCIYLEIRTTPRAGEGMSKKEYIESVIAAIVDNKYDIIVKLLLSIDRRHELWMSRDTLNLARFIRDKYPDVFAGLDLCGNPNEGEFPLEIFEEAKQADFKITLHCAEVKNEEEVFQMLSFDSDRLGHATFVHPDYGGSKRCWDTYKLNPVPIECCLTSNVVCGTVEDYQKHHVKEWIKQKLPFSLSTDDKGVFCTSLSREYSLAADHFELSQRDLWNISFLSVNYTFATKYEKESMKTALVYWKNKFLIN